METRSIIADTFTIGGVLGFIIKFTPVITALVLTTALILNVMRMVDWFKNRDKKDKDADTTEES